MGEAKQRAQREAAQRARFDAVDFARVAAVVRAYLIEDNASHTADALTHAALARHLLQQAGLDAELVVGFAAWRVGPGDGDIVSHGGGEVPPAERLPETEAPHHAWLETGGHVFDVTTYQLVRKAAEFDRQHAKTTAVTWCPDFVLTPRVELASFARVRQPVVGLMYYQRDAYLQAVVAPRTSAPNPQQRDRLERICRDLVVSPAGDVQRAGH